MVRDGELTSASLASAVAIEQEAGLGVSLLAVGDMDLELVALNILRSSVSGVDCLRAVMPQVSVDPSIGRGAWELRGAR